MRTKALLCAAAVAASAVTAMAQTSNVYSLNVVGYVNITIPTGYSLIANPLDAGNNSVSNLFNAASAGPALGNTVYYWNGSAFFANKLDEFGSGWANPSQVFAPGTGFFVQNAGAPYTNTFVGTVMQGSLSIPLPVGYSLVASKVPQAGFVADLGLSATPGDSIYLWNGNAFFASKLDEFGGGWGPVTGFTVDPVKGPNLNIGQSLFYQNGNNSANVPFPPTWNRTFTVQ